MHGVITNCHPATHFKRHELSERSSAEAIRTAEAQRPQVIGKFLFIGDQKFYVKGVSYGAFRPDEEKREYQDLDQLEQARFGRAPSAGDRGPFRVWSDLGRLLGSLSRRYQEFALSDETFDLYFVQTRPLQASARSIGCS
jgi:hypothetical protein